MECVIAPTEPSAHFFRTFILRVLHFLIPGMFNIYIWEAMRRKASQTQTKRDRHRDFEKFGEAAGAFQTSQGMLWCIVLDFEWDRER